MFSLDKHAVHKLQVVHNIKSTLDSEKLSFDAHCYVHKRNIQYHLQIYAEYNAGEGAIVSDSNYNIFYCVYGKFVSEADSSFSDSEEFAKYKIPNILLPHAQKYLTRLLEDIGAGYDADRKLLDDSVDKNVIDFLVSSGEIRIINHMK